MFDFIGGLTIAIVSLIATVAWIIYAYRKGLI